MKILDGTMVAEAIKKDIERDVERWSREFERKPRRRSW